MVVVAIKSIGKLLPGDDENVKVMADLFDDKTGPVDLLGDLKYIFAIGDLDPKIGRISAS